MTEYYRHTIMAENGYQRVVPSPISMSETLTLRDQFAMAALTGMIADPNGPDYPSVPKKAYEIADAMLETRKEKK